MTSVRDEKTQMLGPSVRQGPGSTRDEVTQMVAAGGGGTSVMAKTQKPKHVYLVRHAERMDRIFPLWMSLGFANPDVDDIGAPTDAAGHRERKYTPWDLNMPLVIPKRTGGYTQFKDDTPITETGALTSQLIGRGLSVLDRRPTFLYSSPALRCLQTAEKILRGLGNPTARIRIEPGLFEQLASPLPPAFLPPSYLQGQRYPVDTSYTPIITLDDLGKRKGETREASAARAVEVVGKLSARLANGDCLVVVAHAGTLDGGARGLLGKPPRGWDEDDDLGTHYPYSCVLALHRDPAPNAPWTLALDLPPVTHNDIDTRINSANIKRH